MNLPRPRITLAVTGIGIAYVDECLRTLFANPLADEMLFVHDDVGRSYSDPAKLSTLNLDSYHPSLRVVRNRNFDSWAPCNQTANLAVASSDEDWLLITHEDTAWPVFDYVGALRRAAACLEANAFILHGHKVVGVEFHIYEARLGNEYVKPRFFPPRPVLTQYFMAHTCMLPKWVWRLVGKADEREGLWWDTWFQEEALARNWWFLCLPLPFPVHQGARSLTLSCVETNWSPAPAWSRGDDVYIRRYQKPYTREEVPWHKLAVPVSLELT
jgi:hypothetical protein